VILNLLTHWSCLHYSFFAFTAGVRQVLFSPQENYLLTSNENPDDPVAIKIYHIPTGKLLRAFPLYPDKFPRDGPPPPFLWSHDDQYLARMGDGLVSIFETPSMRLLDKRSLAAEGISEFQWCPTSNVLAYWAPEQDNSPAHVDLIEIPSREKLRQKNLFNVTRCSMVWHSQGDYLAVKVTRHTKSKKTLYNNIELFRLNEVGIPVEMLDTKDAVMALQFEPRGSRFAMIHAESPAAAKVKVSFYDMMKLEDVAPTVPGLKPKKTDRKKVPELNLLETLEGRQCNFISWSPAGSVIIMASLGDSASGTLEFYDVVNQTLVVKEHYRANQVHWDPAGRTVASVVSQPIEGGNFKFAMDNGFIIWSFQGKQLNQQSYETFYQFIWRPRETLLSTSEIKKVRRNLKKYEKQFDRADRRRQRALYLEETKGKREERSRFRELVARNTGIHRRHRAEHIRLLGGYDSEDDRNYKFTDLHVETILSTKEEVIVM
jgi:translation initiation factor 3 subunit B